MGLPEKNTPWPPTEDQARYDRMRVNAAWYAGDPDTLTDMYGGIGVTSRAQELSRTQTVVHAVAKFFWGQSTTDEDNTSKLHVDVPGDIARLSAELLHSDPPQVKVLGPVWDHDEPYIAPTPTAEPPTAVNPLTGLIEAAGPEVAPTPGGVVEPPEDWEPSYRKGDPKPETVATQARLEEILDRSNWGSLLLQGSETGAALGCYGIKIDWDEEVDAEAPFLTVQEADAIVPEYRNNRLIAVTYWSYVERGTRKVVRWLERHERGAVYHGVYEGSDTSLGQPVPVTEYAATRHLAEILDEDGKVRDFAGLELYRTGTSIPNMLPDPTDRLSKIGRSDYSPSMIGLFDAIDRVYTSLMRDIENGQGRLIVADYMLDDEGAGKGVSFDRNRQVFSPLKMQPGDDGDAPITIAQFQVRVEEHIKAAEHLIARVVMSAGYNMRTMGSAADGVAITATQTLAEDRRSLSTRDKKTRYSTPELEKILEALLAVDKAKFSQGRPEIQVFPVEVRYNEGVQPDLLNLGQVAQAFKNAEAASIRVRVETIHPDWDESRISTEVAAIQKESGIVDPNTFGLGGVDDNGDPVDGI